MPPDSAPAIPEFTLVLTEKGGQERRIPFSVPELTVGRVQGNDLVLPKGNVSKRHARILFREGRFIVTDLNSTNGTYVNRRRITQATIIRDGDKVYVGDFVIRVESQATSAIPVEPPAPTPSSEGPVSAGSEVESPAPANSVLPGWERPSSASFDEFSRPSSGPPPRLTDAPVSPSPSPAPVPEGTSGSERVSELSSGHRQAVHRVVAAVVEELGSPGLEPEAAYETSVRSRVHEIADHLLAEGGVPVGTSAEAISAHAIEELLDLGPLRELIDDPAVTSVSAACFYELSGTRDGRLQTFLPGFSSASMLELAIRRLAARAGGELTGEAVAEVILPGGARLSVVRGAVAPDGPLFTLQKPRRISSNLDDLVRRGAVSRTMATFLAQCVAARLNILVVGPREEGARTVLSALCAASGRDRVVTIADFDDIAGSVDGAVRLDLAAQGSGDVKRLLEVTSGLSEARLAVTLNRPEVLAATLEVLGAGTSGVLAATLASNLSRCLLRMPADVSAVRPGVALEAAAGWILASFDLAIEVARLRDGRVRVLRIAELGRDAHGQIAASDIFRFSVTRVAAGGAVEGNFAPSGEPPRIAAQLQAMGIRVENSLFSRPASR